MDLIFLRYGGSLWEQWSWLLASLLLCVVLGVLAYYVYLKYIFKYVDPLRDIPGPEPTHWFFGNLHEVIREETGTFQQQWARDYGAKGMFKVRAPGPSRLYITDLNLMQQVLVKENYDFPKPKAVRDAIKSILGEGVLVAEGDVHRKQRKALNPAFAVPRLKQIVPLFHGPAYKLRDLWLKLIRNPEDLQKSFDKPAEGKEAHLTTAKEMQPEAPGQDVQTIIDVSKGLSRCTLDIIGLAGFDSDFNTVEHPDSPIAQAYLDLIVPNAGNAGFLIAFVLRRFVPGAGFFLKYLPMGRQMRKNKKKINDFTQSILADKRRKAADDKVKDEEDNGPKDLLSILVSLEQNQGISLTDEEINDQCMTFLAAGHETTSTALLWCLLRLSQDIKIQSRLREEVLGLISPGSTDRLTYDDLTGPKTAFLDAVCRESLRLDSPVPFTQREAKSNTMLGGHFLPKGTPIVIAPLLMNRHPDHYGSSALQFDPTRWLKDEEGSHEGLTASGKSPYAFLTFLAGPRNCIGQKFAVLEMKTLLAILIANFEFYEHEPGKHIERTQQLTLRPKQGFLNLRVRQVEA